MKGTRNLLWFVPLLFLVSGPIWWSPMARFLKPRGEFNLDARSPMDKVKTFALEEMILTQSRGNQREMLLQSQRVFTTDSDALMGERSLAVQRINDGKQVFQVKNRHAVSAETFPVGDPVAQNLCDNFPLDAVEV